MNKMGISEANQLFMECERFAKHLEQENRAISQMLKKPNEADLQMFVRSNDELVKLTKWRLEQLEDASERAGWWNRKVAISYIKKITNQFTHIQWGLHLLDKRDATL